MEVQNTNLVRKQYLMSKQELSKIDAIRVSEKKSAAEVFGMLSAHTTRQATTQSISQLSLSPFYRVS
jgi:hypothetical protein